MSSHPIAPRSRWLAFLGHLQRWAYAAHTRHFLGVRRSRWALLLILAIAAVAFWNGWPTAVFYALIAAFVAANGLLWFLRRRGYKTFLPGPATHPLAGSTPLPAEERVTVRATGYFASQTRESYIFDRGAAEYWRLPLGEHAVMVPLTGERFLYQFFDPEAIETVVAGRLITRGQPALALAISFWTSWLPADQDSFFDAFGEKEPDEPRRRKRMLFLSFDDVQSHTAVWQSILTPPA